MTPGTVNHLSLAQYWNQGDAASHCVAYLLLVMSLLSWYLMLSKGVSAWHVRRGAHHLPYFWAAPRLDDGLAVLALGDTERIYLPLAQVQAQARQGKASLDASLPLADQLTRLLRDAIQHATVRLEWGLTTLASIGATAPFVGLLGTVWGIYHALATVSQGGALRVEQLAGPVGEALIMTAAGLLVAIPAVLAYNGLNRINRLTLAELDAFAHDLHAYALAHMQHKEA